MALPSYKTAITPQRQAHFTRSFNQPLRRLKHLLNNVLLQQKRNNFIYFPSVKALAGQFQANEQDIYHALEDLRTKGFDYEIIASREPIRVWQVSALAHCAP